MTPPIRVHFDSQLWKARYMRLDASAWAEVAARNAEAAADIAVSFGEDWSGLEAALADAEVLLCQAKPPAEAVRKAPRLKLIMVTMAGVEKLLPLDWLPDGVRLANNSGTHAPKTREFAGMALAMLHFRLPHLATAQRAHAWAPRFEGLIGGRSVVVVGFGTLGQATAEAARALGLEVRAVRRNPAPHPLADAMFPADRLVDACAGADFLVSTLPLTLATRGFVAGPAFDALNPDAGVINIGRGPVMDYAALAARLDSGRLSGAILDVFATEPLPADEPLWDQKNLIVMPHMSSDDPTSYIQRSLDIFVENVAALRAGAAKLPTEIDRATGY